MLDWLTERVNATPEMTALIIGNESWTYGQLNVLVNAACQKLFASGVQPGQVLGVLMPNGLAYVCLVHALARLGVVLLPLNTRLTPAELDWQLTQTGCDWVIYDEETAVQANELAQNGRVVLPVRDWRLEIAQSPISNLQSPISQPFSLDTTQAIVFTSGTTGRPKGAMLTFGNHFWSAMASAYRLGVERGDRWLSCLPLYHVGGLAVLFRSCLYGTAVIMHDGFHIEAINESLDTQQVTLMSLVPTMLYRLLQARTRWPDSLRLVLLGGAAATADLITHAHTANVPIATTYGLTEAASQVATMLPDDMRRKPGCVGKPLLFTAVRIVNENGESCLPGEYGEIVVSGPTIMQGYVNNKEATAKALCNGELYTGDIGYVDEAGDLWLVQRRSDVIVTGGENVYPAEVEAVLKAHPAVTAVCVAGVDHPEWGQQVAAMIVLNKPGAISEAELLTYCRDHLAGYKLPRLIQFAGALPQTASGKIHRQAVAKRLQAHAHL